MFQAANAPGPPGALERPKLTYVQLIKEVIESSPTQQLSLKEMYEAVVAHYPYYSTIQPSWKNVIRHCLSITPAFQNLPRQNHQRGKGGLWYVDYTKSDVYSRKRAKRGDASRKLSIASSASQAPAPVRSAPYTKGAGAAKSERDIPPDDGSDYSSGWSSRGDSSSGSFKYGTTSDWSTSPKTPLEADGGYSSTDTHASSEWLSYWPTKASAPDLAAGFQTRPSYDGGFRATYSRGPSTGLPDRGWFRPSDPAPPQTYEVAQSHHAQDPSPVRPGQRTTRALSDGHWPGGSGPGPPFASDGWSTTPPVSRAGPSPGSAGWSIAPPTSTGMQYQYSQSVSHPSSPRLMRAPFQPTKELPTALPRPSPSTSYSQPGPHDLLAGPSKTGPASYQGESAVQPNVGSWPDPHASPPSRAVLQTLAAAHACFALRANQPPPLSMSSTTSTSTLGLTVTSPSPPPAPPIVHETWVPNVSQPMPSSLFPPRSEQQATPASPFMFDAADFSYDAGWSTSLPQPQSHEADDVGMCYDFSGASAIPDSSSSFDMAATPLDTAPTWYC